MASEHEHNDWRYTSTPRESTGYAYATCRVCGAKGRRLLNTNVWEMLEEKPTYQELEQQLAQARALLKDWMLRVEQFKAPCPCRCALIESGLYVIHAEDCPIHKTGAFLAPKEAAGE